MTIDNATQIDFWNGETGRNWVTHAAIMEAMLQPLGESVMDTLAPQPGNTSSTLAVVVATPRQASPAESAQRAR